MNISIPFKEKKIEARIDTKSQTKELLKNNVWIILTHGAGGDLNSPQLAAVASFLMELEFTVLRFTCKGLNIKYRINVFSEVLKYICNLYKPKRIFIGGRSMGARAAVMLKVDNISAKIYNKIVGVICLSYPLHKVNNTKELRDEPLMHCEKPLFFLSGSNDEMCNKEVLENVLLSLKCSYEIYWLNGYNHSAKSHENYEEDVYIGALQCLSNWCNIVSS